MATNFSLPSGGPTIPPPLSSPGQRRRGFLEQLLMGLAGQTGSALLGSALQPLLQPGEDGPPPPNRQRQAAESVSLSELQRMGAVPEDISTLPEEEAAQLRLEAPERLTLIRAREERRLQQLAEEQQRQQLSDFFNNSRAALVQERDALTEQLGMQAPQVGRINDRIAQIDAASQFAAIEGELTPDIRADVMTSIAPSMEAELGDFQNRMTLRALSADMPTEALVESAPDSLQFATILETAGLLPIYTQAISGQQSMSRLVRGEALRLQTDLGLEGVPAAEINRWLRTGEAAPRFSEALEQHRAEIDLTRKTAGLGLIERALDTPVAQIHADQMRRLREDGDMAGAVEEYNALRRTMERLPGVDRRFLNDFLPPVTEVEGEIPPIVNTILGSGTIGGLFREESEFVVNPAAEFTAAHNILSQEGIDGNYDAAISFVMEQLTALEEQTEQIRTGATPSRRRDQAVEAGRRNAESLRRTLDFLRSAKNSAAGD